MSNVSKKEIVKGAAGNKQETLSVCSMKKLLIHRRARPCAVAALVSVSLPGGAPPALAAPTRADEVRAVLANPDWELSPPFTRGDFRRLDESDDAQAKLYP